MRLTTLIVVGCIHLSFLVLLAAAKSCNAGDCSKHTAVFPSNETPKHKVVNSKCDNCIEEHNGNYKNSPTTKDVYYEGSRSSSSSISKENLVSVKHARTSKGLKTASMELHKAMPTKSSSPAVDGRSDFRSGGDYDSYDPAPALVKPPFKLIPN